MIFSIPIIAYSVNHKGVFSLNISYNFYGFGWVNDEKNCCINVFIKEMHLVNKGVVKDVSKHLRRPTISHRFKP